MDASVLLPPMDEDTVTTLDFSIGSNRSSRLDKNSFTRLGDNLIRQVSVKSPSDLLWRASLSQNQKLTTRTRYTIFSGVGQTVSRHSGIDIQSMQRIYPDELSIERDLAVAPQKDLQNNGWYYRIGGDLTTNFGPWQTRLAFYHQRYVRDQLDQRIRFI